MADARQAPRAERHAMVRNVDGGAFLERFFVSGVLAFLILRLYLQLTGFPKVGGHGLHIAHMLWGGLLMLVAIVILLAFLGQSARAIAAVAGGVGFGIFIDELGKFITSDNNYFYQPAIALIYAIFVLLFLALRAIERQQPRSEDGYLVNALTLTGDAVLHGFDRDRRARALALLTQVPPGNVLAHGLRDLLEQTQATPEPEPAWYVRVERWLRDRYTTLARQVWFSRAVIAGFVLYGLLSAVVLAIVVLTTNTSFRRAAFSLQVDTFVTALADVMIVVGAISWRRSRLAGLAWFRRSILVTILLAQPFLFYREQLAAAAWLAVDVVVLEALNYMAARERAQAAARLHSPPAAAAPARPARTGPAGD